MMSPCPIPGDVNLDHLIKMESVGFSTTKLILLSFTLEIYFREAI
jgi:hypothetical protein